jgi:hypothetical protein
VLLTDDDLFPLHMLPGRRLGQARVNVRHGELPGPDRHALSEVPLNYALLRCNVARADDRVPVLAVGSNGSLAQIRHKYHDDAISLAIPMVKARVEGLAVGMAPDVARGGYVPATPILGPDLTSELFVHWLDPAQLDRLDQTERSYHRILLSPGDSGVRVTLPSGEVLGCCYAYTSVGGYLTTGSGSGSGDVAQPLELTDQPTILKTLQAASPRLRELLGDTARSWVERFAADPGMPERVRTTFVEEGLIRRDEIIDRLVTDQEAPMGGPLAPDAGPRPYALPYGRIPPDATAPDGTWRVVPSREPIARAGQTVVRLTPEVLRQLGNSRHVAVQPAAAARRPDTRRLETIALALSIPDDDAHCHDPRHVEVDQVVREAIGIELGEDVTVVPVTIRRRRWPDLFIGRPLYFTCRVQLAELASAEREVCLLDPLALEMLGVQSGEEVVVEGQANAGGEVEQIRIRAFTTTEAVQHNRESMLGGDFSVRYPSARDALGIHPDIPWIFLDSSTRWMLRIGDQRLATVRVRPSRSFQLRRELREMLLVLGIAFIGLIELVTQTWARLGLLATMVTVVATAIAVRMRGRLSHRVVRGRHARER